MAASPIKFSSLVSDDERDSSPDEVEPELDVAPSSASDSDEVPLKAMSTALEKQSKAHKKWYASSKMQLFTH